MSAVTVKRDVSECGLSAAVAIHVAKLPVDMSGWPYMLITARDAQGKPTAWCPAPDFAESTDSLWPLLGTRHSQSWTQGQSDKPERYYFAIYPTKEESKKGLSYNPEWGTTPARALAFALLRQAGVTITS